MGKAKKYLAYALILPPALVAGILILGFIFIQYLLTPPSGELR